MSKYKFSVSQSWNTVQGWTVAERVLPKGNFEFVSTSKEEARMMYVELITAYLAIANHQKNAFLKETDTGFILGRNGKPEITLTIKKEKYYA